MSVRWSAISLEAKGTVLHWIKVKGHSKDLMNDRADYLATAGMHGKWDKGPEGRTERDGRVSEPAKRQAHKRNSVVDRTLQELRAAGISIDQ